MKKSKKGAVEIEFLIWLAIACIAGFVIVAGILILKGKGISVADCVNNLLRFGGCKVG